MIMLSLTFCGKFRESRGGYPVADTSRNIGGGGGGGGGAKFSTCMPLVSA